jgi:CrcB protein
VILAIVAICLGASLGALLRWQLGLALNTIYPAIPLGTLAANLLGGFLVGLAVAYFTDSPHLPPHWRLLVVTGFLGGLTTFSTFSAEVVENMLHGHWSAALAAAAAHLFGSLALTAAGISLFALVRRAVGVG